MPKQLSQPLKDSKEQKSQKLEFSKKLTIIDMVMWGITSIGLIIVLVLVPEIALYCQNMLTTFATVYVSLRLGYTAKAGVENYKKISQSLKSNLEEVDEDDAEG